MPCMIEPITSAHIEAFHGVFDGVARERKYLVFLEAPPLDEFRAFVERFIAAGRPHFVAIADARLVGWCDVTAKPRPAEMHCGVLGIGVDRDYRGQGLGRALMEKTLAAAFALGLHRVELTVRADNGAAQALYRQLGFRVEGYFHQASCVDGEFFDVIAMALRRADFAVTSAD